MPLLTEFEDWAAERERIASGRKERSSWWIVGLALVAVVAAIRWFS